MASPSRRLSGLLGRTTSVPALLALAALAIHPGGAAAGPQGESVASGAASVSRDGALTRIDQASERALIDWRSFDVGRGERVDFRQPGASSLAVNRVTGGAASALEGQLTANGSVWLLNPQGVMIGRGARLSTNGFLAGSATIDRADFERGNYRLTGETGAVENHGTVETGPGGAALLGPRVVNAGDVSSRGGNVALAAGRDFTVDLLGGRLLGLTVTRGAEGASVEQTGTAAAKGGDVNIAALAYGNARRSILNLGGVTSATRIEEEGGAIRLSGGPSSRADLRGALEAPGGTIAVDAERIAVHASARIDVSGSQDGGSIDIGRRESDAPDAARTDRIWSRLSGGGAGSRSSSLGSRHASTGSR